MNIGIIDYQASNLGSLSSALREIEQNYFISSSPEDFKNADLILLPGVGSFTTGMNHLIKSGLDRSISDHVFQGKPVLGICLGMHLLATTGTEGGNSKGLNLIPGEISKLVSSNSFRVPHMGWDEIMTASGSEIVYFAHSYYFRTNYDFPTEVTSTFQNGDVLVPAQVKLGNISGIQYHPEKSGRVGLRIMEKTIQSLVTRS
jgi:glutamine amidotransferase